MDKKQAKIKNKQKKRNEKAATASVMIEAKVPSACYELSVKPANHSIQKHESG
jgi:hypothetical protein